jgi:hypothetical protein
MIIRNEFLFIVTESWLSRRFDDLLVGLLISRRNIIRYSLRQVFAVLRAIHCKSHDVGIYVQGSPMSLPAIETMASLATYIQITRS